MKIETVIKNEVRKYKKVVERAIQNKKVDLDRLERKKNQYYWNCEEKNSKANLHYTESRPFETHGKRYAGRGG